MSTASQPRIWGLQRQGKPPRNPRERANRWALYPPIVVGAVVAHGAAAEALPIIWAFRAIVVAMAATAVLQLLATAVTRDAAQGGLAGLVTAFVLMGEPGFALAVLFPTALIYAIRLTGWPQAMPRQLLLPVTRWGNTAALILGIATVVTLLMNELGDRPIGEPGDQGAGPDIYLVLLDGYPRADTLLTDYGFDNQPFLSALGTRGFDVAEQSQSNYNLTPLTLSSMFEMQHVDDIADVEHGGLAEQWRSLRTVIGNPAAVSILREHGYHIKAIASPFPQLTIRSADEVIDTGELNWYEIHLLEKASRNGPFGRLLAGYLADQHRSRVDGAFAALAEDHPGDTPRFVFVHVMSPHVPFVFGPDGEQMPLQDCFPSCGYWDAEARQQQRPDFAQAAVGQIRYLNDRVLQAVDRIQAEAERPTVILVMSDHGSRLDDDDSAEMLRNFFAAYTPGHAGLFPDDTMPVMVFPRLVNTYLGENVPEPDRAQFIRPMQDGLLPLDYARYHSDKE